MSGDGVLRQEVTFMVHDAADRFVVAFDDERAVANAGVMLPALLAGRLGIESLVDTRVNLGDRPGGANPGRKVMTMLCAMALGADCIEDCDVLRSGQTAAVLGHRVAAPSTLGTFLRAFTFGHVRQLDRVLADSLQRAWAAGAGPGEDRLIVDVDSFVGEVHGHAKQGAGFGYTGKRGYHPILATRAGTGEVLHIRARKGQANTSRGALRFVEELIPRVARAGATGPKLLRTDSGFWNKKLMAKLEAAGWTYSIGVPRQPSHDRLVDGPDGLEAQLGFDRSMITARAEAQGLVDSSLEAAAASPRITRMLANELAAINAARADDEPVVSFAISFGGGRRSQRIELAQPEPVARPP